MGHFAPSFDIYLATHKSSLRIGEWHCCGLFSASAVILIARLIMRTRDMTHAPHLVIWPLLSAGITPAITQFVPLLSGGAGGSVRRRLFAMDPAFVHNGHSHMMLFLQLECPI